MNRLSKAINPHTRCFLFTSIFLFFCVPVIGQQVTVSAPLTADAVINRVVEMNKVRAGELGGYSSLRSYHLECHCLSSREADMVVRVDYEAPDKKVFTIESESGSGMLRNRVFKKLLEAEEDSTNQENQQRSAITPDNYKFRITDYKNTSAGEFYVLDAQPRSKNKFLFRGLIWVDAKEFAITRIEGEPAQHPSWWTLKTDFNRRYQKIGKFWLPESNQSETKVRIFGTAVLKIEYHDYQLEPLRAHARHPQDAVQHDADFLPGTATIVLPPQH